LVAAATGSSLLCETFFARVDRGGGRASPERLIYFPTEAQKWVVVVTGVAMGFAGEGWESLTSWLLK